MVEQWLCERYMSISAMSHTCYHFNGLVHVIHGTWEVGSHIMSIVKPSTIDSDNLKMNEKLILDARLLERVLTTPIFIVKSIHLRYRLTFSQVLKDAPYKVLVELGSLGV